MARKAVELYSRGFDICQISIVLGISEKDVYEIIKRCVWNA